MRATGKTLEEYMTENIWGPLGMKSTTFDPWVLRSDLASRVTGMMARNAEKNLVNGDDAPFVSGIGAQDFSGGGGGLVNGKRLYQAGHFIAQDDESAIPGSRTRSPEGIDPGRND